MRELRWLGVKLPQLTTNILKLFLSKTKQDCADGLLWAFFFPRHYEWTPGSDGGKEKIKELPLFSFEEMREYPVSWRGQQQ